MSAASRKLTPFGVRLPDGLRDKLKQIAQQNRRSMNAELLIHLEAGLNNAEPISALARQQGVEHA